MLVAAYTVAALLHVHSKLTIVEIGYQLSRATREHKNLLAEQRKLQVEMATLRSPRRIREIATERFGMNKPADEQIVPIRSRGKVALQAESP